MEVKHGTLHPTRLGERKRAYPGSSPTPPQQWYSFDNRKYLWNLTVHRLAAADWKIHRPHRTLAGIDRHNVGTFQKITQREILHNSHLLWCEIQKSSIKQYKKWHKVSNRQTPIYPIHCVLCDLQQDANDTDIANHVDFLRNSVKSIGLKVTPAKRIAMFRRFQILSNWLRRKEKNCKAVIGYTEPYLRNILYSILNYSHFAVYYILKTTDKG